MTYESTFEQEVFEKISNEKKLYAPLEIEDIKIEPELRLPNDTENRRYRPDAIIKMKYQKKDFTLIIEIKNRTAPKIIEQAIRQLGNLGNNQKDYVPTLLVPYLNNNVVNSLEQFGISGLDLNGNYFIKAPDLVAIRLDKKNNYKESVNIKNIYNGRTSIVGRYLLKRNIKYNSVSEIYENIFQIGGNIALSTVSKALKRLEEDLIIQKNMDGIRLLQPEKLLDKLKDNYTKPKSLKKIKLRIPDNRKDAANILKNAFGNTWMWSGESSAEKYVSTTSDKEFLVYVKTNILDNQIINNVDEKFYNCIVERIQTSQDYIFFDSVNNWASRLQAYLELCQLGKREKEIAQDLSAEILNEFNN